MFLSDQFNYRYLTVLIILSACLSVQGCGWLTDAPEARALDFIETAVYDPTNVEKLRDRANIADNIDPLSLISDLSCKVSIEFLQAQLQVDSLDFVIGETKWPDPRRKSITIYARGSRDKNKNMAVFIVDLEKQKKKGWRIIKIRGA